MASRRCSDQSMCMMLRCHHCNTGNIQPILTLCWVRRSPRRQRPLSSWNSNNLLGSMSNALKSSAAFALPTPHPQQQCFLLRRAGCPALLSRCPHA